jgi:prophage regulatory protein
MPRFLRFPHLAEKGIPFSRMHVDRLEKRGEFPQRVHIGRASVAWVEEEIDRYIAGKVAARKPVLRKSR